MQKSSCSRRPEAWCASLARLGGFLSFRSRSEAVAAPAGNLKIVLVGIWLAFAGASPGQEGPKLVKTIPLPGVEGRIDHLAVDVKRQRLFVAALGNNTLEVVDLLAGKRVQTVTGLAEPQGAAYDSQSERLFVANGQSGMLDIFGGSPLERIQSVKVGDDADNVRFDAATKQVIVGYGSGALAFLDAGDGRKLGEIKVAGHPESFQLEDGSARIFVNIPGADQISVVDREKRSVTAKWPLALIGPHANFPLAVDKIRHRVFSGCRVPPRVLIYDSTSGELKDKLDIGADTDDLFYDSKRRRLYVVCGGGSLDVFGEGSSGRIEKVQSLATAPGARTALFVPELDFLCVAVPHRGGQGAEVRIYRP